MLLSFHRTHFGEGPRSFGGHQVVRYREALRHGHSAALSRPGVSGAH